MIERDEETNRPIIKVIGVGGGGGNAANFMHTKGIKDVDFVVCNTDAKALELSPISKKIIIGEKGLGAGNKPEVGRQAAIDSLPEIEEMLDEHTEMVFVTAGMGGGTGTGAAPVIAKAAKQKGILTVGIVTIPFVFEGKGRLKQALEGVEEMRKSVDAIIIITNERIKQLYGNMKISQAFAQADSVLATAAKGIAELITRTGSINVDMNDVRTVLTNSGDAIMGSAITSGQGRALEAIQLALESPLLTNNDISLSDNVLLNISSGDGENEAEMDELNEITEYLQDKLKPGAQIIWGYAPTPEMGENLQVTIVVTGLHLTDSELSEAKKPEAKPVAKPTRSTNFLDDILGSSKEEPVKTEPKNSAASEPEKVSDERVEQLAKTFYGTNVLDTNAKTEDGKAPSANVTTPSAGTGSVYTQSVAPTTPTQEAVSAQQPQPLQQEQAQVQQAPAEPEPPAQKHMSLDDFLNDNSLNNMERPNLPKGNDDTQTFEIP